MTPIQIRILLHYHCSPAQFMEIHDDVSHVFVKGVCEEFFEAELLSKTLGEHPRYTITNKGRAMVDHLCDVQIPVCQWVQP